MSQSPEIDLQAAHRFFAAECFNRAWELLDQPDRTSEEDEQMIRLSLASHWHWTQREDYGPTNASIAYWQTSRVYAMLGQPENARRYAESCLEVSQEEGLGPFFLAYAHEAQARAESMAGNRGAMEAHLAQAREIAETLTDAEAKQQLLDDLESIQSS